MTWLYRTILSKTSPFPFFMAEQTWLTMFLMIHFIVSVFKCDFTLLLHPIYGTWHILLRIANMLPLIDFKKSIQVWFWAPCLLSIVSGTWTSLLLPILHFSYALSYKVQSVTYPRHLNLFLIIIFTAYSHSLGLTISYQNTRSSPSPYWSQSNPLETYLIIANLAIMFQWLWHNEKSRFPSLVNY